MAKTHITRTFGPIHFEDLDPHRFEDLIRELTYDYKDWQSIEATGRTGSDEGFDIRAYEKLSSNYLNFEELDTEEILQPMNGNLWMIQCKREGTIGPQKVADIIESCINKEAPPYGYILVAPANFSTKSYDRFRKELIKRKIFEFYLWGKAELEDMLHMPKFDRILFTFFGISLITRTRSKTNEIRTLIATKNKLFKIIKEETNSFYKEIFIRDINDSNYPKPNAYNDFEQRPRWQKCLFVEFHISGILLKLHEYFSYYDKLKNEWDYSSISDLNILYDERETEEEDRTRMDNHKKVRDFWNNLPQDKQSRVSVYTLIKYEDILIIDEKGDGVNNMLHLYVNFNGAFGLFKKIVHAVGEGANQICIEDEKGKRIKIFPSQ